jgi:hypothetical protein
MLDIRKIWSQVLETWFHLMSCNQHTTITCLYVYSRGILYFGFWTHVKKNSNIEYLKKLGNVDFSCIKCPTLYFKYSWFKIWETFFQHTDYFKKIYTWKNSWIVRWLDHAALSSGRPVKGWRRYIFICLFFSSKRKLVLLM